LSSAIGLTAWQHFILLSSGITIFYSSHWEEYHTNHLILGRYANPTEAQIGMMGLLLVSAIFGRGFYLTPVSQIAPFLPEISLTDIVVYGSFFACIYCLLENTIKVIIWTSKNNRTLAYGFGPVLPIIVQNIFMVLWVVYSKSNVVKNAMTPLSVLNGVVSSYVCDELVVHRITKMEFSPIRPILLIPIIGAVNTLIGSPIPEIPLINVLLSILLVIYIYLLYSIGQQLTNHLNICFFTIPPVPEKDSNQK